MHLKICLLTSLPLVSEPPANSAGPATPAPNDACSLPKPTQKANNNKPNTSEAPAPVPENASNPTPQPIQNANDQPTDGTKLPLAAPTDNPAGATD